MWWHTRRNHISSFGERTSPFKLAGASVQSTSDSRGVRISGSNAGYTMFRGSVDISQIEVYGLTFTAPGSLTLPTWNNLSSVLNQTFEEQDATSVPHSYHYCEQYLESYKEFAIRYEYRIPRRESFTGFSHCRINITSVTNHGVESLRS